MYETKLQWSIARQKYTIFAGGYVEGCFGWLLAVRVNEVNDCGTDDSDGVCCVCTYFQVTRIQLS